MSALPSRFACQSERASAKLWPFAWMQKSTWHVVPPNAAASWPERTSSIVVRGLTSASASSASHGVPGSRRLVAGADVVDRHRPAERHVEVRVRVDEPRQDELPRCVDRRVRRDVQVLAEEGDPLAVHEDVADVVVGRRHDTAALDQHGHRGSPFLVASCGPAYLPPTVTRTVTFFHFLPVTSTPDARSWATAFAAYV